MSRNGAFGILEELVFIISPSPGHSHDSTLRLARDPSYVRGYVRGQLSISAPRDTPLSP